jgi:hypothetical protein
LKIHALFSVLLGMLGSAKRAENTKPAVWLAQGESGFQVNAGLLSGRLNDEINQRFF